jgi:uncharacterized SAM-binding protein YcdF (DUF218 family)
VLACAFVWQRYRASSRGPRRLVIAVLAVYCFISTPAGADVLLAGLGSGATPLGTKEDAQGAETIVLLGGGAETLSADGAILGQLMRSSGLRVLEAARVYRMIGAHLVIASGGIPYPAFQLKPESAMLAEGLVQAGVNGTDILQESQSRTTRDQARILAPILRARGAQRFVLVTSPSHMWRALGVFRAEGLDPIPSVSRVRSQHLPLPPRFLPGEEALSRSADAVYGYAAWAYYWWQGWLKPAKSTS